MEKFEKTPDIAKIAINYSEIIKPKNQIEESIIKDARWQRGAKYGKPRSGHPEGKVIYHIDEVLRNVERLSEVSEHEREQLRLITIIHDAFKYKVDRNKPRRGENHHGMLARKFAEKYTDDIAILKIIQLHDEGRHAWRIGHETGNWENAKKCIQDLIVNLGRENLQLYLLFYQCDNETGDKDQESLQWFREIIKKL